MTTSAKLRSAVNAANADLHKLGLTYWNFIPTGEIDNILTHHGLKPLEEAIYCGRDGRSTEQVSDKHWLTMTWYKMEHTGRYEIVAYIS